MSGTGNEDEDLRDLRIRQLQHALDSRVRIEQAKGILMARNAIDSDKAFELLRQHSQRNGRKLTDIAEAIVESHLLLVPPLSESPDSHHRPAP